MLAIRVKQNLQRRLDLAAHVYRIMSKMHLSEVYDICLSYTRNLLEPLLLTLLCYL